jgi:bacteriocin biosynthesis cyclodehydratase domain-containing protein
MYYRLIPDVELVELADSAVLVRSESFQVKLEGASAQFFVQTILPRLREPATEEALLASAAGYDASSVHEAIASLVKVGVLEASVDGAAFNAQDFDPFVELLASQGLSRIETGARLREIRIAVVGLDGMGCRAASVFGQARVGHLTLVDPFSSQEQPSRREHASRQEELRETLGRQCPSTQIALFEGSELTRENLIELSKNHDLVLSTFDRGFLACHQWLNRASLAHGTPTLYGEYSGTRAFLGPLVLPGESGCYLCWRMRHIATRDHFDEVMAYEEHNHKQRQPRQHLRPALPGLADIAGGMLAIEGLTLLLGFGVPRLGNGILVFDGQTLTLEHHHFLRRPDCPACGGITTAVKKAHVQLST